MAKQTRTVILYNGVFRWIYKGMKVTGLDLGKFVRDTMRDCGYPCITCDEVHCPIDKYDTLLNPDIRKIIEELQAEISALKVIVETNHP